MSRTSKLILFSVLLVFVLACNLVTKPISDAQEAVETVQSITTSIPLETIQALPSAMPEIEIPTGMPEVPGIGDAANPQDPPLAEWNGIPVMPAATAGSDSSGMYTYKANATTTEVYDYYKAELTKLGWTEFFTMPDTGSGALLTYEKENHTATITITAGAEGETLVFLIYQ